MFIGNKFRERWRGGGGSDLIFCFVCLLLLDLFCYISQNVGNKFREGRGRGGRDLI